MSTFMRVSPPPLCPVCGIEMRLRRPKPIDHWKPFWGCSAWPQCTATSEPEVADDTQASLFSDAYDYASDPNWEELQGQ